jgi:hypothetical protein
MRNMKKRWENWELPSICWVTDENHNMCQDGLSQDVPGTYVFLDNVSISRTSTENKIFEYYCDQGIYLFTKGPHSRCYGRTAALWWRWWSFFCFSMLMEHRWNEIDRGKPKYSEKNLSQCHFIHHKSHIGRPGIELGPPWWEAGD